MIGELLQGIFSEVAGNDPATRRVASLPYVFGVAALGGQNALGANKPVAAPRGLSL